MCVWCKYTHLQVSFLDQRVCTFNCDRYCALVHSSTVDERLLSVAPLCPGCSKPHSEKHAASWRFPPSVSVMILLLWLGMVVEKGRPSGLSVWSLRITASGKMCAKGNKSWTSQSYLSLGVAPQKLKADVILSHHLWNAVICASAYFGWKILCTGVKN